MKILWLSRHALTQAQADALPKGAQVVAINATFPAQSSVAVREIVALAREAQAQDVAGVFPAHVAARLATCARAAGLTIWIPVSVPAPAVEGETRGGGFVFSHWEKF